MNGHTKGEWKFNGRDIIVGQNIGQQRICTMIEHRDEYQVEDEANARLIVAAPDLLVVCKDAKKAIYEAINKRKSNLSAAWHTLEAVITKAETGR